MFQTSSFFVYIVVVRVIDFLLKNSFKNNKKTIDFYWKICYNNKGLKKQYTHYGEGRHVLNWGGICG